MTNRLTIKQRLLVALTLFGMFFGADDLVGNVDHQRIARRLRRGRGTGLGVHGQRCV